MPLGDEGRKALAHAGAPGRFRDGHESILSVGGKDTEILSAYAEGSKMPLVERGDVTAHVTIREDYDRGLGHSDVEEALWMVSLIDVKSSDKGAGIEENHLRRSFQRSSSTRSAIVGSPN